MARRTIEVSFTPEAIRMLEQARSGCKAMVDDIAARRDAERADLREARALVERIRERCVADHARGHGSISVAWILDQIDRAS